MKEFNILLLLFFQIHVFRSVSSHMEDKEDKVVDHFYRSDYTYIKKFNGFYKRHDIRVNFFDAVETCANEGAVLWVPGSLDEVSEIYDFVDKKYDLMWVGLHDKFAQNTFAPIDGRPEDQIYINWGENEPNDESHDDCVVVGRDYKFYNGACRSKKTFMCRIPIGKNSLNAECETYDPHYVYDVHFDHCYKIHAVKRDWHDAFRVCRAEGGNLAIVNSYREARHLSKMIKKALNKDSLNYVYIGFNDLIRRGFYMTVEGQPLEHSGYTKWNKGQPDNYAGNENCGALVSNGHLADVPCWKRKMFICEKTYD